MAKIIVLIAALASVHGNTIKRAAGWGPPSGWTTTTPGWTTPPPTSGWTEPPTTSGWGWTTIPPGWSSPPGWGPPPPNVDISLTGELAAVGSGWAAENHAENIQVTGGWGVNAELLAASGGESVLAQEGAILQVTNVDSSSASSLNAVSVDQVAEADEGLAVIADGLQINVGQSGWASVTGEGASAAAADTLLLVNQ